MTTIGVIIYLIATIGKYMFLRKKYDNAFKPIILSIKLNLKKGDPETLLSFPQVVGVAWICLGIIEILLKNYINTIPFLMFSVIEVITYLVILSILVFLLSK
jgi:hypothetical protein